MQRPQLQDKLNIVMHKWDTMQFVLRDNMQCLVLRKRIWPKWLAHTRNYATIRIVFFLAVFLLAEFFSGSFSANAVNIRLGSWIRLLGGLLLLNTFHNISNTEWWQRTMAAGATAVHDNKHDVNITTLQLICTHNSWKCTHCMPDSKL